MSVGECDGEAMVQVGSRRTAPAWTAYSHTGLWCPMAFGLRRCQQPGRGFCSVVLVPIDVIVTGSMFTGRLIGLDRFWSHGYGRVLVVMQEVGGVFGSQC